MEWLEKTFSPGLTLASWQLFGLAYLLGSFTVATLSDLKRLSAQREFLEVWILFVLVIFGFEYFDVHSGQRAADAMAVKWGLIALLSLFSLRRIGVLFRLAPGDVAALAATASLLSPTPILIFFAIAKAIDWVVQRAVYRNQPFYPFMPIVSLATLAVLSLGLLP